MKTKLILGVAVCLMAVGFLVINRSRTEVGVATQSPDSITAITRPGWPPPGGSRAAAIDAKSTERLSERGSLLEALLARRGIGDDEQRREQLAPLVSGSTPAELEEVLEDERALLVLPEDVWEAMLRRLARDDAPWTGDYLQMLPDDVFRSELLGTVMTKWGSEDLSVAVDWVQKLTNPGLQQTALVHLSYQWFKQEPEEALAYAALHPTEHHQLLNTLVGLWSREQPEAAAAWAAEYSTEPVMTNIAASAVTAWAQKDDLAAAAFVMGLPEGKLRDEASISVMSALARNDPATGALWATVFPAGQKRNYAIENLVYNWAVSDPESALAWASHLPAGERDTAIFAGAGGLIDSRPDQAARWAVAIQDEHRRNQQTERVVRQWLKADRWSAEDWIRRSPLPEQTKLRLLASASGS